MSGFDGRRSTAAQNNLGFYDMSLADYVKLKGGKNPISKVLIANNGIAAVKAMRSIKKWSYETFGRDDVIKFVAMATPEDIKVNAAFIHIADEFAPVPGGTNNNNYSNVDLIVKLAERYNAQAVWPGWGHASENPALPDSLAATKDKIIWIGPPSSAMRALGDKIGSTLIAQSAGVPCMPWSGTGICVEYAKSGIPEQKYEDSCVRTAEQAVEAAKKIGYPIMIKASEGGGGKGVRKVDRAEDVAFAFQQVQGEVPGSPVFLMKLASNARHLEVQLLGDEWGDAIAIFGRDCSIQRRFQKIIEEGPVLAAPKDVWRSMEQSAVTLAKEVGYCGAGTVEYLFFGGDQYSFLELNPRLQVEHTVTEGISGTNLPSLQLQVAMGIPLHNMKDIRTMFGEDPLGDTRIDFDNIDASQFMEPAHVIACRITAENPDDKLTPTAGSIEELSFRSSPNVFGYFSVNANGGIHEYSDSQFGHVFAKGRTREEARRHMVLAMKELMIRGEIRNTVEFLQAMLECDDFKHNRITTAWLDGQLADNLIVAKKPESTLVALLGAIFNAHSSCSSSLVEYMGSLERGQLPSVELHTALVSCDVELIYEDVKYHFKVAKSGPESYDLQINDFQVSTNVRSLSDGGVLVMLAGQKHVVYGKMFPSGMRLTIDGQTCLFSKEYDPTRLCSSVQGKLVRYLVKSGDHVLKGQPYAELEVMKMYVTIKAPEAGIIETRKPENSVIEAGDLLAECTLDDAGAVKKAVPFTGSFPAMGDAVPLGAIPSVLLQDACEKLNLVMDGFKTSRMDEAVERMMSCLRDPCLPLAQFTDIVSSLSGRIPASLWSTFQEITSQYANTMKQNRFQWEQRAAFPVLELNEAIEQCTEKCNAAELAALNLQLSGSGLNALLEAYCDGNHSYAVSTVTALLDRFLSVEAVFDDGASAEEVISSLRKQKSDIDTIARFSRAHHAQASRTDLVLAILDVIEKDLSPLLTEFQPIVQRLATLQGANYARIGLKTRILITSHSLPTGEQKLTAIRAIMSSCAAATGDSKVERLAPLLDQSQPIEDILFGFFGNRQAKLQKIAMEATIRRSFSAYDISEMDVQDDDSGLIVGKWRFAHSSNSRGSSSNLASCADESSGTMVYFRDVDTMKKGFTLALDEVDWEETSEDPQSVLYIVAPVGKKGSDEDTSSTLAHLLAEHASRMTSEQVLRRVTFVCIKGPKEHPGYFTYVPEGKAMREEMVLRHIEPCYATHMELEKLSNFNLSYVSGSMVNLFAGTQKNGPAGRGSAPPRLFARALVRQLNSLELYETQIRTNQHLNAHPEIESAFLEALNSIEIAMEGNTNKFKFNHIFINVLVATDLKINWIHKVIRHLARSYASKIRGLNVSHVELAIRVNNQTSMGNRPVDYRVYYRNPTGYALLTETYIQVDGDEGEPVHKYAPEDYMVQNGLTPDLDKPYFDGKPILEPYPAMEKFQSERSMAHSVGTLYCYDFLIIFEKAVAQAWKNYEGKLTRPEKLMTSVELVLDPKNKQGPLLETTRDSGKNDIGMVAFKLTVFTPEAPKGRDIVLISNDIAFQMGTFGPDEDLIFGLASIYARERQIPRLYFSANSGARIGLAQEVQDKFQIAWTDDDDTKGYDYLYLSEADYSSLTATKSVQASRLTTPAGEVRYKITDIIGQRHGLGVENLSGSGWIAGETSVAYEEIFTLTVITGRSVGIGAYLARLGQRCIQKAEPILLTGYQALNKLLGKNVYTSNAQLGGPDIMYTNGVSHLVVDTDFQCVQACLDWLAYVPEKRNAALPISPCLEDPVERAVQWTPTPAPYDPRNMLAGVYSPDGSWTSGFFDKDSFMEVLGGWAKTVVCGRARLGGYPMGVVAVECRTTERIVPADPANPTSVEQVQQKAGQVWYPDSAYKTAQGIRDMIAEDIPLIIFANWRGFSGGQQDMFDEVLKYGSYIVDSLRDYKQPIFVYIPPNGTLRGGAWVVVDSTINAQYMEMYADPSGRGGVLEAEGIVSVKFRRPALIKSMHRLDPTLQALDDELAAAKAQSAPMSPGPKKGARRASMVTFAPPAEFSGRAVDVIQAEIKDRESQMLPYYHTVATAFADLHDTPGRMLAKEVITAAVPWAQARSYFYWRMRRRLVECQTVKKAQAIDKGITWQVATEKLNACILGDLSQQLGDKVLQDDKLFAEWVDEKGEQVIDAMLAKLQQAAVAKSVSELMALSPAGCLDGFVAAFKTLDAPTQAKVLEVLK